MKTLILFFSFCFLWLTTTSQGWAPIGARWHYTENFSFWNPIVEDYIKIESVKDTVVAGKVCRKLTKRHNIGCSDRPDIEFMYSENNQVFFFDTNFSSFQILYDFGAIQGDSWAILVKDLDPPEDVDTLIVSVDSTNQTIINGISLKQLFVTYKLKGETNPYVKHNSTIIESIGDLWYMFNYYPEWALGCDMNFSEGLRCYEDSLIGLFETGIADSCEYIKLLDGNEDIESPPITIYPVPANEVLLVKIEKRIPIQFKIYDFTGKVVLTRILKDNRIPVYELKPGIYIIELFDSNESLLSRQKILIN